MDKKRKILVVDDEPIIRKALAGKLASDGYDVEVAEDGEKAINILNRERYDMIISDIMMPFISGLELLYILKNRGSTIPVLMLTSMNSKRVSYKAFQLGAKDLIQKPPVFKDISKRVRELFKNTLPRT